MIEQTVLGVKLTLETNEKIFSPNGVDTGTLAMLAEVSFNSNDKVLDLGCGCGVVGITAAKLIGADRVVMCDIDEAAVEISRKNAAANGVGGVKIVRSDGLEAVDDADFTIILSNPPYHTDFAVAKGFIENGYKKLALNGRMVMVTKRLDWYKNKLTSVFGGVRVYEREGYYVFVSEKREKKPAPKKDKRTISKKLERKLKRKSPR